MRKDNKEQQKKAQVRQLELFSKTSEPAKQVIGGTDETVLTGVELSSRLERQRALTKNLMEEIVDYANLKMVCPTRAAIFIGKNEGVKVNETALVRTRMPGGVGGQR